MTRLRQMLDTLRIHGLTLKLEKFILCKVYRISRPRNQRAGSTIWTSKFVENFEIVAEPLTRLTKKNVSWIWQEEQERAFNMIKDQLTTRPVLTIFNPEILTEIHTDASAIGIGTILLQRVD
ncbi:hypothetical protein RF55_23830, partial [Lasius niger]